MASSRRKKGPRFPDAFNGKDKVVAYGYVGRWNNGGIGWCAPQHFDGSRDRAIYFGKPEPHMRGSTFELCRITVEVVPGARKKHVPK